MQALVDAGRGPDDSTRPLITQSYSAFRIELSSELISTEKNSSAEPTGKADGRESINFCTGRAEDMNCHLRKLENGVAY